MLACSVCSLSQNSIETCPNNLFITKCQHIICFDCFDDYITEIRKYPTPCFGCHKYLTDSECEENVCDDVLHYFYETKSHFLCVDATDKFQCFDPACTGIYTHFTEEELVEFICPKCNKKTCCRCKGIHEDNETCEEWQIANQDLIKCRNVMVKENKRQKKAGLSMECVNCKAMVQKLHGCDGVLCPCCSTGLCFKTKQKRWGPNGEGDISEGCKCMWDGKTRCHPRCKGCFVHQPINSIREQIFLESMTRDVRTILSSGQIMPLV